MTEETKLTIDSRNPRKIRPSLKTVFSILGIATSLAGCVWVFKSPWLAPRKTVVSIEDILDRTRRTSTLCIMKVYAKGAGVHAEREDSKIWEAQARGWTADTVIDIIIDLGKVTRSDMSLIQKTESSTIFSIVLPPPEFDERTFSYDPKNSRMIINHGNISDTKFRNWSADCFTTITNRISETVRQSGVLTIAREPARAEVACFFKNVGKNMGIEDVVVRFKDEESLPNQPSTTTAESGAADDRKE